MVKYVLTPKQIYILCMNIRDAQKLSDDIVARIKEEKESRNISNYRLAEMCNLSEAYLSYVFNCKRSFEEF